MKLANKLDLSFILNQNSETDQVNSFQQQDSCKRKINQIFEDCSRIQDGTMSPLKKKQRTCNILEHLIQAQSFPSPSISSYLIVPYKHEQISHPMPYFAPIHPLNPIGLERTYSTASMVPINHQPNYDSCAQGRGSAFSPVKKQQSVNVSYPSASSCYSTRDLTPVKYPSTSNMPSPTSSEEASEQASRGNSPNEVNVQPTQVSDYTTTTPIQQLANYFGFATSSSRSWRYRDVKRSLMENRMSLFHKNLIERNPEHWLLKERLPHKISYINFAKRIQLIVYHFIVRDGNIPSFYAKLNKLKQQELEKIVQQHDADFAAKFSIKNAFKVHGKLLTLQAQQIHPTTEMLALFVQEENSP